MYVFGKTGKRIMRRGLPNRFNHKKTGLANNMYPYAGILVLYSFFIFFFFVGTYSFYVILVKFGGVGGGGCGGREFLSENAVILFSNILVKTVYDDPSSF